MKTGKRETKFIRGDSQARKLYFTFMDDAIEYGMKARSDNEDAYGRGYWTGCSDSALVCATNLALFENVFK